MNMAKQSKRNGLELGTCLAECKQEQHVHLRSCALKSRLAPSSSMTAALLWQEFQARNVSNPLL
jgi:hypothetical protein